MKHLLVTNDFPPKVGGIQSYLWELWRRLPSEETAILTTAHPRSATFDAAAPMRIERIEAPVMLPSPRLRRRIDSFARDVDAEIVLLDPALPLGHLGPSLDRPYGLVLHGAEVTVPGRVPGARRLLARTLRSADLVIAAGGYPADEGELAAGRGLPVVVVPPGVDVDRFHPIGADERRAVRSRIGVPDDALLVVSVSRLVPRKGFDVLIRAAAELSGRHPDLLVAIGGAGRDEQRLRRLAERTSAPVKFLGRVPDDDLAPLYGSADLFSMTCRNRWMGLEQEGFGIVFLEAAACGVAQVAGDSGGAAEAVAAGVTGLVVDRPSSTEHVTAALDALLTDGDRRKEMGAAGRLRATREFSYDALADRLREAIANACVR